MSVRIVVGDALEMLRTLPSESIHMCCTSPPYFGLRDYGVAGQIGLEPSPAEYVDTLVAVFRDVRRVLRKDGTLWLNLGDSYAAGKQGRADTGSADLARRAAQYSTGMGAGTGPREFKQRPTPDGLKPKDLLGIPWRVAFALQADGWWLRQDIIWSKPNPMPESVTDRCTKAHEYLFLLSRSERYYFDADRVRDEPTGRTDPIRSFGHVPTSSHNSNGYTLDALKGANKRSVWTIATAPFPEAHFATFPPALVEPCILAGSPRGGVVLDPFGGAGTTGLVADRLGRSAILIELNRGYARMAERRITDDAPLFAEVDAA